MITRPQNTRAAINVTTSVPSLSQQQEETRRNEECEPYDKDTRDHDGGGDNNGGGSSRLARRKTDGGSARELVVQARSQLSHVPSIQNCDMWCIFKQLT